MHFAPFAQTDLGRAAALLTQVPPERAEQALRSLWHDGQSQGVLALNGDQLAGYLLGSLGEDSSRGKHGWIHLAGAGLAPGRSPELYRDLYAHLAADWVRAGAFAHYVELPAADDGALKAWFHLGFGLEQIHALRPLDAAPEPTPPLPPGVAIRRATPADLEPILAVADLITTHQVRSPVFAYRPLPDLPAGWREGYGELLADPACFIWLAEGDGRILAYQVYSPHEGSASDLLTPPATLSLDLAATRPEERGRGLGRALTAWGMQWAAQAGYRYALTDWRATNLLSSRFWPSCGFQPLRYRLHRLIDPRIAGLRTEMEVGR